MVPPSQTRQYAKDHDNAIWDTFCKILESESLRQDVLARKIATLPGKLGGLGLRSAERTAPGAFWASWVVALEVIQTKLPTVAGHILADTDGVVDVHPRKDGTYAHKEAAGIRLGLLACGLDTPTWLECAHGIEPQIIE